VDGALVLALVRVVAGALLGEAEAGVDSMRTSGCPRQGHFLQMNGFDGRSSMQIFV
jgi:hypothetical protein